MARVDRFREFLSEPFTEDYLRERMGRGWRLVAVEWERQLEGQGEQVSLLREIFSSRLLFVASKSVLVVLCDSTRPVTFATRGVALAA